MKTRNAGTPKSAPAKKTPPVKKSASKTPPTPPPEPAVAESTTTPKIADTKVASASKVNTVKTVESKSPVNVAAGSKPKQPVEEAKPKAAVSELNPVANAASAANAAPGVKTGVKTVKKVIVKKIVKKKPGAVKTAGTKQTPKSQGTEKPIEAGPSKEENVVDSKDKKSEEPLNNEDNKSVLESDKPVHIEESTATEIEETKKDEHAIDSVVELPPSVKEKEELPPPVTAVGDSSVPKEPNAVDVPKVSVNQEESPAKQTDVGDMEVDEDPEEEVAPDDEPGNTQEDDAEELEGGNAEELEGGNAEELEGGNAEELEGGNAQELDGGNTEGLKGGNTEGLEGGDAEKLEGGDDQQVEGEDAQPGGEERGEEMVDDGAEEVIEELEEVEEEVAEDDVNEQNEADALEAERVEINAEINAAAKERKLRKQLEIFIGGLDRDATEEDVKKAFGTVGEVVGVRFYKNKGYAFVKFATKEQAARALSEMKNPLIHGRRCRTGPSEDNETLFVGNICNTWTKEAIKQKLKDQGLDGVENITLVPDPQHEGLSRGFAFVEFSCHADAMLAYKRLQKPDVVFGHAERSVKVAFAEPLREPDPEVMSQVKSVFIDGIPPQWDEDKVREQLKGYGEIARINLARNMSTAKRKDFGFVDFTTHEAAVACIEGMNKSEFGDGSSKTKVKARLSNPLPKTQAVKGGMVGGFRIDRGGGRNFPRYGRNFGRSGPAFGRPNFQRGREFAHRGPGQAWRAGAREHDMDAEYPPYHQREMIGRGGWREPPFGGARGSSAGGAYPPRDHMDRIRHDGPDRGHGGHIPPRRQPFMADEGFNRPFPGRHFDDPYLYDDGPRGMKRPLPMPDAEYMEPSRLRPRLDYSDPADPYRGPRYRDSFGAPGGLSRDYYGSNYGEGSYSSFYGNDRPYGGGYYY